MSATDRGLVVELIYTRDEGIDLPCGGWALTPRPPDSGGPWLLWDTIPDRKSGWLRVWARGGVGVVHVEGGNA